VKVSEANGVTKQDLLEMEARLKMHVSEECEKVETKLLAEFWKWGRSNEQKMRRVEFSDATTVERMAILEERVFTLERKAAGSKE
jgi:hypothetical protein